MINDKSISNYRRQSFDKVKNIVFIIAAYLLVSNEFFLKYILFELCTKDPIPDCMPSSHFFYAKKKCNCVISM